MNLYKTALVSLFSLLLAVPLVASAQTATPRFDQRQANQEKRIEQGEKSGTLTSKEAARLENGQDRLQTIEDKAKADGQVTAKERARMARAENKQSARIYRQKHDPQRDLDHNGKIDRPLRNRR